MKRPFWVLMQRTISGGLDRQSSFATVQSAADRAQHALELKIRGVMYHTVHATRVQRGLNGPLIVEFKLDESGKAVLRRDGPKPGMQRHDAPWVEVYRLQEPAT